VFYKYKGYRFNRPSPEIEKTTLHNNLKEPMT